jgi:ubiquinone/menaquinone biosynthesis C-methylase UbiE/uncharacterized protein YbaR (Trm112 family)
MKEEVLEILQCPKCRGSLRMAEVEEETEEIRRGTLVCSGKEPHRYSVVDGIMRFATGFDHQAVQRELAYENSTYIGNDKLTDAKVIGQFPESLGVLWPHTVHFGPDFRMLIDQLPNITPRSWILDVGTAACWSSRLLAERGGRVIALDVTEADYYGLKAADIQFRTHDVYFERVLESMTNLPIRDEVLDAITFNASFHHTPDLRRTLQECHRTLKPGGVAAMVNEEFASVRHHYFSPKKAATDTGSHHDVSYREFASAAQESGFAVKYLVTQHVRERLRHQWTPTLGDCLVQTLERFPALLKQLNSALVCLTKLKVATTNQTAAESTPGSHPPMRPLRAETKVVVPS